MEGVAVTKSEWKTIDRVCVDRGNGVAHLASAVYISLKV